MTFDGRQGLIKDIHQGKTDFEGSKHLMEDNSQCKTTNNGKRLQWRKTFDGKLPLFEQQKLNPSLEKHDHAIKQRTNNQATKLGFDTEEPILVTIVKKDDWLMSVLSLAELSQPATPCPSMSSLAAGLPFPG